MYLARDGTPQVWGCPASPGGFKGDRKSRGAPLPAVRRGGTRQTPPGRFWRAGDLEARPGARLPPAPARWAPRNWPRSASEGAVPVPRRARISPLPAPTGVRSGTGRVPRVALAAGTFPVDGAGSSEERLKHRAAGGGCVPGWRRRGARRSPAARAVPQVPLPGAPVTNFSFVKGPFSGIRHLKSHYKPRPDAVLVCSPSRNHSTKSGRNQRVCPSGADSSRLLCATNRCAPAPGSASRGWGDAAVISSRPGFRGSRGTPGPRPNGPAGQPAGPRRPWQRSVPRRRSLPTSERRNAPRPLRFVNTVEYLTFTITCKYSGHFLHETLFFLFFLILKPGKSLPGDKV